MYQYKQYIGFYKFCYVIYANELNNKITVETITKIRIFQYYDSEFTVFLLQNSLLNKLQVKFKINFLKFTKNVFMQYVYSTTVILRYYVINLL